MSNPEVISSPVGFLPTNELVSTNVVVLSWSAARADDITFGSDRFRGWLALLDPPSASQPEHTRRLSRCEWYRGIIGIQSQENRSIHRQFDV
jgi:hypothetical protein